MVAGSRPLEPCRALAASFEFFLAGAPWQAELHGASRAGLAPELSHYCEALPGYLQSLFRVFSMLEDLEVPFPSFSQLQLHDAVLALHRTFDGSLTFGDNVLKALRWSQKAFQLDLPSLHSGIFASTALFQRTGEKREATPIPLAFAVWLEFSFLKGIEDMAERMFIGAVLLCLWASLRFGDAQHVRWSSLLFDVNTLRGWCYNATKQKRIPEEPPLQSLLVAFAAAIRGTIGLLCFAFL